jgi:hypothetical protein
MKRSIPKPSPAMAVACLALLVALGGVGVAATSLPANSVGRVQLKPNAVSSAKVANGTLRAADFAAGTLLQGPAGPPGPAGPQGPAGGSGGTGPTGGTAGGSLTGTYPNPQIAPNVIGSAQVIDGSITGADIALSTLPQVLGRWATKHPARSPTCTPTSSYGGCADITLKLATRSHVLLLGRITGTVNQNGNDGDGNCRFRTSTTGVVPGSAVAVHAARVGDPGDAEFVQAPLVGITDLVGPGEVSFFLDCNSLAFPFSIRYLDAAIAALVISPS